MFVTKTSEKAEATQEKIALEGDLRDTEGDIENLFRMMNTAIVQVPPLPQFVGPEERIASGTPSNEAPPGNSWCAEMPSSWDISSQSCLAGRCKNPTKPGEICCSRTCMIIENITLGNY